MWRAMLYFICVGLVLKRSRLCGGLWAPSQKCPVFVFGDTFNSRNSLNIYIKHMHNKCGTSHIQNKCGVLRVFDVYVEGVPSIERVTIYNIQNKCGALRSYV